MAAPLTPARELVTRLAERELILRDDGRDGLAPARRGSLAQTLLATLITLPQSRLLCLRNHRDYGWQSPFIITAKPAYEPCATLTKGRRRSQASSHVKGAGQRSRRSDSELTRPQIRYGRNVKPGL